METKQFFCCMLGGNLLRFRGSFNSRLGYGKGRLDVPAGSPFAALGLGRPARTIHMDDMTFVAQAPRVIRQAAAPQQA